MAPKFSIMAPVALAAIGLGRAVQVQDRPVMKIVNMLKDMEAELQAELKDDKEVHETLSCWCETNRKEKTAAIEMANAKIAQLEAAIGEAMAKLKELKEKRTSTLAEVDADHAALSEASALRIKENKAFQAAETDLIEAIQASKQAITVLSKHHPELAQVRSVVGMLQAARVPQLMAKSGSLSAGQLQALKAFLQEASGAQSFLAIPGFKSYAPQSGQIFGILQQMQEDFEKSLAESQAAEKKAVEDYESLKAAKEEEIASGRKAIEQYDADIGDISEKHAVALQELDDTEKQLALDEEFLKNLEEKCANSEAEYEQRVKDRMAEIEAVEDTIKILNSDEAFANFGKTVTDPDSATFVAGTASFLQESSNSRLEQGMRMSASAALQRIGASHGNPKLVLLAASVKLDAFTKVKAEIDKLVAEYKQQMEDEIAHKDWCTAELNKNERETSAGNDKADGLRAKIADLEKEIESLTADLDSTKAANAEMETQMKRASETREGENALFQQTVADQRLTQQILNKAIERMMQVYQTDKLSVEKMTATLVQAPGGPHIATSGTHTDPGNGPARFADNAEQNAGGNRVIAMLDEVLADSQKTENEAIASESDSQQAYENFMQDSNKSLQNNLNSIANMQEAKAKAEESLSNAKTDLTQTVQELSDLNDVSGDLHKSCDFILKNFDARQAARAAEIDAMNEAKNILSGMK